jgi:hypothetical protein
VLIVKIDCQRAILSINHPVKPLLAGGPDRNRTCDTRFRKPLLYPLSYGAMMSFLQVLV